MSRPYPLQRATLHFFCGKAGAGKSTIARELAAAEGAILLCEDVWLARLHGQEMKTFDELFNEYLRAGPLLKSAAQAQVRGLIIQSTRPRGLLYQHPMVFGRNPGTVPVVLVAREQADRLAWLADRTEVRVRMDVVNRIGPSFDHPSGTQ